MFILDRNYIDYNLLELRLSPINESNYGILKYLMDLGNYQMKAYKNIRFIILMFEEVLFVSYIKQSRQISIQYRQQRNNN